MTRTLPIISAVGIGKSFVRNPRQNVSRGVSDILRNIACLPLSFDRDEQEFWAVEKVSLDIYSGDAIGIIGRNGGGKTTLMKMLAGLITPSRGNVSINGQIQALINLGAGFNQRLSGRENVTNGIALRGLNVKKSADLFDRIIDFSEIGPFIDSPVETYSSGMKSRLGFALCAYLEPDLIVIDEALSVGDVAFQNKCKFQLQAMKQKGVAMLLVSHSMTSIKQFCDRAIWLHEGKIRSDGPAEDVTADYLLFMEQQTQKHSPIQNEPAPPPIAKTKNTNETWRACAPRLYVNVETTRTITSPSKAAASFLARNQHFSWDRPAISKQYVDELYGGYIEPSGVEEFSSVLLVDGKPSETVGVNESFSIEYGFRLTRQVSDLNISLVFHTEDGKRLSTISTLNGNLLKKIIGGRVLCKIDIEDMCFAPGSYVVTASIHEGSAYLWRDAILAFRVSPNRFMVWNQISLKYRYNIFDVVDG